MTLNFGDVLMKLTRIAALVGMMALAAPAAYAQGGGQGGQGRGMQRLMQGITLDAKQQASVDSIQKAFRAEMPPMQQGTPPDSATRAKRMEVMQKEYAAIRNVLTADQQKVFDKNVAEMREQMKNRPKP
jgi:Spy/CpxP family protein refolding chaperone